DWEEMAAIGIAHLARAPGRTMVSFGQGCEGEPLTRAREIGEAIRRMRQATGRGCINVNTNGSLPGRLALLIDAGLDACRISLNSAHKPLCEADYQPIQYGSEEVEESIRVERRHGGCSLCPGMNPMIRARLTVVGAALLLVAPSVRGQDRPDAVLVLADDGALDDSAVHAIRSIAASELRKHGVVLAEDRRT